MEIIDGPQPQGTQGTQGTDNVFTSNKEVCAKLLKRPLN